MKIKAEKALSFPYPTLNYENRGYKSSTFKIDILNPRVDKDNKDILIYNLTIDITSKFIREKINTEEFGLYIHFEQRGIRQLSELSLDSKSFKVDRKKFVNGKNVEVQALIINKEAFELEYFEELDDIYKFFSNSFVIDKGSIIGFSNSQEIEILEDKRVGALFNIISNKKSKEPVEFALDNDMIVVSLQEELYRKYITAKDQKSKFDLLMDASFVYTATYHAINKLINEPDLYGQKQWAVAILNKIRVKEAFDLNSINKEDINIMKYVNIILDSLMIDSYKEVTIDEEC